MKRFPVLTLLFLYTGISASGASSAGDDVAAAAGAVSPLTLSAALQLAADHNPALAAQRHDERAAAALVEQAALRPNPTLDVELENFLGTGQAQGVRSLEATVQANQTLERGGKRAKRVAVAESEREVAAWEYAVQRAEVLTTTALAFVATLAAQQRLALTAEPLQLARAMLADVEERVRQGMASSVETARARAAVAAAQAESARAQAALAAARATLAATWGGNPAADDRLSGRIHVPESLPAEETFLATIGAHPRLQLQEARVATRRAAFALEEARAAQDITVGGGVRFLREGTDATLVAGVSVPLPVRNRNQGNIRAARESLAGAELATRAVESELRATFQAAWLELQTAHATATSLRRDALPAMAEAHEVVRRAYDAGQLSLIDVFDAQRALIAIQREILEAESAYALAFARVESLANPMFSRTAAAFSSE